MSLNPYLKIIACIYMMAASHSASAQLRDLYLYMQVGGGWGTSNTMNIGATAMYKKFAFTFDYIGQRRRADNVPADYNPGLTFFDDGYPRELLEGGCIEGGLVFYFANQRFRFLARGGLFYGSYTRPDHFTKGYSGWFGPNYQTDWETLNTVGLTIHPTIECPGFVPVGLSAGVRVVVSSERSSAAIDFNVLFGKVRKSRRRERRMIWKSQQELMNSQQ